MYSHSKTTGFTLIEILIAITIFAILSVMAYSGLATLLNTRESTEAQAKSLADLQIAMSMIERDATHAIGRPTRDEYGDTKPAIYTDSSEDVALSVTRIGWRNPLNGKRSNMQHVSYRVEEEQLIRSSWTILDLAPDTEAREMVLLEGVQSFDVQFSDGSEETLSDWPPLNEEGEPDLTALPRGIEITLDLKNWGEIQRIFRLPG